MQGGHRGRPASCATGVALPDQSHRGHRVMRANRTVVAGQRLPRLDGPPKVTGRFVYGADFALPGTLYGKVLRSDVPHARLVRIDTSRARTMPGVRAVITSADIPA